MEAKAAGFSGVLIHLLDLLAGHVLMGWTAVGLHPFISSLRSPFVKSNILQHKLAETRLRESLPEYTTLGAATI